METIDIASARRLALARGGLLKPEWTRDGPVVDAPLRTRAGLPPKVLEVIHRFGYLQLDTVSVAGARSHAIVLMSRIEGFDPQRAEKLLRPGTPLFEYWGHEASWIPLQLYPVFGFRRKAFRTHPWWGDVIGEHPRVARELLARIRSDGPLRSAEMDGRGSSGWWDIKTTKLVATALWSSGELAIRERVHFQRIYDLTENVIDPGLRRQRVPWTRAMETLLLLALQGHGWASAGTLAQTFRLRNCRAEIDAALDRLARRGEVVGCVLSGDGSRTRGWIRPVDLELADRLRRVRPRSDRGVLLSPFDPVLWDRGRVQRLFEFHQLLEIFKPAGQRTYGYFCLPVLAGEYLVARLDLKADRRRGRLQVLACHLEEGSGPTQREAARHALQRYADALELQPSGLR